MTESNSNTIKDNLDAIDLLEERLEQLYAMVIVHVGNEGFKDWNCKVTDGYFGGCATLVQQAREAARMIKL